MRFLHWWGGLGDDLADLGPAFCTSQNFLRMTSAATHTSPAAISTVLPEKSTRLVGQVGQVGLWAVLIGFPAFWQVGPR
jgi:hypothetical protein